MLISFDADFFFFLLILVDNDYVMLTTPQLRHDAISCLMLFCSYATFATSRYSSACRMSC